MKKISTFGLALASFGAPLAAFSFFILSETGLTAFGLACTVLGGALSLTPWSPVPKPPVKAMIEGSCINVEALLEEFDARGRAIYLPPKSGRVYAYVPLREDRRPNLKKLREAPARLVADTGDLPGLLVYPPGSELLRHSNVAGEMGAEPALYHVLVDFVEAVEGVTVAERNSEIEVTLTKPKVEADFPRFEKVLGYLATSMAASTLALTLDSPVTLKGQDRQNDTIEARFEVLEDG